MPKTIKVKVTARTPGRAGVHALGTHKKAAVFFPNGQPVELEVTSEHEMQESDEFGNVAHKLRSQLSILEAHPELVVERVKGASELRAEAEKLEREAVELEAKGKAGKQGDGKAGKGKSDG